MSESTKNWADLLDQWVAGLVSEKNILRNVLIFLATLVLLERLFGNEIPETFPFTLTKLNHPILTIATLARHV